MNSPVDLILNNLRLMESKCLNNGSASALYNFINTNRGEYQTVINMNFQDVVGIFVKRELGLCGTNGRIQTQQRMGEIMRIVNNNELQPPAKSAAIIKYITSIQGRNIWTGQLYRPIPGGKRKTHKRKHRRSKRKSHKKTYKRRSHRK
jgi:hypothetical protein